jgi:hypothetical protein
MTNRGNFTRKDFINLGGLGLFGMISSQLSPLAYLYQGQQGRVAYEKISTYAKPTYDSEQIRNHWKDSVLPITGAVLGGDEPSHNRIWYKIGAEGYAHSGGIQPVKTVVNLVNYDIPSNGVLAEVTVPYSDALWTAGEHYRVAYRLYYETTHWITSVVEGSDGNPYYKIQEDKWDLEYFVPAEHLRIVPTKELTLLSPNIPNIAKRIEVRTSLQIVIAYEYDKPVFMVKTATGADFSTGQYITPQGHFLTNYKRPSRHMAANNLAYNGYDLPGVPWVSYITESGIAFHGTYWHNDFGKARSHGCINLTPKASKWLYRWTLPTVPDNTQSLYSVSGTQVDVID